MADSMAGSRDLASLVDPGFTLSESFANGVAAVASGVGEGVTRSKDTDADGVTKPATTVVGASEKASFDEPDSCSFDGPAGDTEPASFGVVEGRGLFDSSAAKPAEIDAGLSATALSGDFEFIAPESMANEDNAAASDVENSPVGGDMEACDVAASSVNGERASNPTSPFEDSAEGSVSVFRDLLASTTCS
ncbi:MAG: hypothetical protein JO105_11175 [Hyphomicrobiales bacterium]|nr:hypothetical protein [Hyphomicrobiales bacterium]